MSEQRPAPVDASRLVGRPEELELLRGLVTGAPNGAATVLVGEPGIGKSALLGAAHEAAVDAGRRVLTAVGIESEAELPYAGLHQLARGTAWPLAGRYDDAFDALARMMIPADPVFHPRERFAGIVPYVDAAVRSGNRHAAEEVVADLERIAVSAPARPSSGGTRQPRHSGAWAGPPG